MLPVVCASLALARPQQQGDSNPRRTVQFDPLKFFVDDPPQQHVLTSEEAGYGICLDGSPPSFDMWPAPHDSKRMTTWVLYLQGGGWCMDPWACRTRTENKDGLGSSWIKYDHQKKHHDNNWLMSGDESTNPDFFNAQ